MEFAFRDRKLERLYVDRRYNARLAPELVTAFRDVMDIIRDAPDEREFYALKSLHFEKLAGPRKHQHSMKLNNQFRLVVELTEQDGQKQVFVVGIEDYHH